MEVVVIQRLDLFYIIITGAREMMEEYVEQCIRGRHRRTGISGDFCHSHPLDVSSQRQQALEIHI